MREDVVVAQSLPDAGTIRAVGDVAALPVGPWLLLVIVCLTVAGGSVWLLIWFVRRTTADAMRAGATVATEIKGLAEAIRQSDLERRREVDRMLDAIHRDRHP